VTSAEIRALWLKMQLPTTDHTYAAIAQALYEIAAQLAELNESLRPRDPKPASASWSDMKAAGFEPEKGGAR